VHRSLAALPLDRSLAAALSAATVAFAIDAPGSAATGSAARCAAAPRALLVSNPQRNLWAASDAVPALRAQLERRGFTVELLEGAAVTRTLLTARLADPCTQLFHYDGHARGAAPGGAGFRDRVDDALLLAGGEQLTAAEILGLPRVPPAVVLNGCTTAAPEGLGLAQAFLVAGAAQVVASLEELPSEEAARFTRLLYEPLASGASLDLVSLFARAMAAHDVAGLRAFER
jgi:CHAT domain-containing protein